MSLLPFGDGFAPEQKCNPEFNGTFLQSWLSCTWDDERWQTEIEHMKDDITIILEDIKQHGIDLTNVHEKEKHLEHETRCAWRYRIRTLCHAYIKRGWMSHEEFSQLQEMFNLYTAIGGNGQTKELYERTMQLDIKTEAEIAALQENQDK